MSMRLGKNESSNKDSGTTNTSEALKLAKRMKNGMKTAEENEQDIFTRLTMTLPKSINGPLEDYINAQKRKGIKKVDIIYKKDRKISKSSYMVEALINQMKRDGIID